MSEGHYWCGKLAHMLQPQLLQTLLLPHNLCQATIVHHATNQTYKDSEIYLQQYSKLTQYIFVIALQFFTVCYCSYLKSD